MGNDGNIDNKLKRPKGWRVTSKKVKVEGCFYDMYETRIWKPKDCFDSYIPIIPNMLSDTSEKAILNGWGWLEYHLSQNSNNK